MLKKFFVTLVAVLIPVTGFAAKSPLPLTAKSAIVIEASTGEVLYAKNPEEKPICQYYKNNDHNTALEAGNVAIWDSRPNAANTRVHRWICL